LGTVPACGGWRFALSSLPDRQPTSADQWMMPKGQIHTLLEKRRKAID
jgi:hypothetical protein